MKTHAIVIGVLLFGLVLIGCGGGSGDSTSSIDTGNSSLVSSEIRNTLPDSLDISDVFMDGIPLVEDFKMFRTSNAVTLSSNSSASNRNSDAAGRYLEVGEDGEEQLEIAMQFDMTGIQSALQGIDHDDIESVILYLWNENGESMDIQLSTFDGTLSEGSIITSDELALGHPISALVNIIGDIGLKKIIIPRTEFLTWLASSNTFQGIFIEAATKGSSLRFSSDETSRAPALVVSYITPTINVTHTVEEEYGTESENERCNINISVEPSALREGDDFTVTINVSDDEELDYVDVFTRGSILQTTLNTNHYYGNLNSMEKSITLEGTIIPATNGGAMGDLTVKVYAEDSAGLAPRQFDQVIIPIAENEKPAIESEIEFRDFTEVHPGFYRLIKDDDQRIRIQAASSDDDGIDRMELQIAGEANPHVFNADSLDHSWTNTNPGTDTFKYTITAYDQKGVSSVYTSQEIKIRDWDELVLYNHALTFKNVGRVSKMDTKYLRWIYGGEVRGLAGNYTVEARGWHRVLRNMARGGVCHGMSATSIALATGEERLLPENLQAGAVDSIDIASVDSSRRYIHSKQGSQLSKRVFDDRYHYLHDHAGDVDRSLQDVINSLDGTFSNYGSLSIHEGDSGHSMVPWMARQVPGGDWKVYVYDSNKFEGVGKLQAYSHGVTGDAPDLNEPSQFPVVDFYISSNTWQYDLNGTGDIWNDEIYMISHSSVVGNSSYNDMDIELDLVIRDHSLPGVSRTIWREIVGFMTLSVETDSTVTISIEDEDGNTKMLPEKSDGNGVISLPTFNGDVSPVVNYLVPNDKKMRINVYGDKTGEYALLLNTGRMMVSIENKSISPQLVDTYEIVPDLKDPDVFAMTVTSAIENDDFVLTTDFIYGKIVDKKIIEAQKSYILKNMTFAADTPMTISLEDYADKLKVKSTSKDVFSFDLSVEATSDKGELENVFKETLTPTIKSEESVFSFDMTEKH